MSQAAYSVRDGAGAREPVPALVTLDVWGVAARRVPVALTRMGLDRTAVRSMPGVTFAKLLGTGSGRTFTMHDADPRHWGVLIAWDHADAAAAFSTSRVARAWAGIADEHARFRMRPLSSRGTWAGRQPFGDPVPHRWDGHVAAVTRARIRPTLMRRFWGAVPPVSLDLDADAGILFRLGIGEAPLGLQGTFSVWASNAALTDFAHRRSPHAEVMRRTQELDWYAEELFARFAVVGASGRYARRDVALPGVGP